MLRIGLDFSKFTPRREERPEVWFQRFDDQLEEANRIPGFGHNITFQHWMFLSLLGLGPPKWFELLWELSDHILPSSAYGLIVNQFISSSS